MRTPATDPPPARESALWELTRALCLTLVLGGIPLVLLLLWVRARDQPPPPPDDSPAAKALDAVLRSKKAGDK